MFGIKLQLRSFSIKRCYSFRPIASYRDARGEETHAHTHAHLFLVKWFVTLSEIACRLPGFQRGKDRITIIGKSIGVSSPGNITSMEGAIKGTKVQCPTSNNVHLTPSYFAVGVQFRSFSSEQVMLDTTMGITCSIFPYCIKGVGEHFRVFNIRG